MFHCRHTSCNFWVNHLNLKGWRGGGNCLFVRGGQITLSRGYEKSLFLSGGSHCSPTLLAYLIMTKHAELTLMCPAKINAPRYTLHGFPTDTCNTFCILARFDRYDKVGHSASLYYECSECSMYISHVCKKIIFSESLGAPCCQNFILESNPYTGSSQIIVCNVSFQPINQFKKYGYLLKGIF